ncbi:oligosaccharide flippase family protein [Flavisolibacter sp. BT320]|nr:oligosaccharide flippase family protein [Flavisolibacter longurius]
MSTKGLASFHFSLPNILRPKGGTSERSIKTKRNIIFSLLIKGGSIIISLVSVPLTIDYINPNQYGIWITLSSIVGWVGFFDVGFGNGLRNKFAECVSMGHHRLARVYVSTTYALITILVLIILGVFFLINPFITWSKILNAPPSMEHELGVLAIIVFSFFCLQFILQLLNTIVTANQESAKSSMFTFLSSLFSLLVVFILVKYTKSNLILLGITMSFTPVIVLLFSSVLLYNGKYKQYAPSASLVKFRFVRRLMGLGIKFFVIQIAALILFQTDNIIITHLFGPSEVTNFNVAYKLFAVVLMAFTIVMTPLWSAITDAYSKNDLEWIKGVMNKMRMIWICLVVTTFFLLIVSPYIFKLWLGSSVEISFVLSLSLCIYVITQTWQTIHVYFLNGVGKIHLQLYLVVICAIVNIPLAIFFAKIFGPSGVILSNSFLFMGMGMLFYLQSKKILDKVANGIWNK